MDATSNNPAGIEITVHVVLFRRAGKALRALLLTEPQQLSLPSTTIHDSRAEDAAHRLLHRDTGLLPPRLAFSASHWSGLLRHQMPPRLPAHHRPSSERVGAPHRSAASNYP